MIILDSFLIIFCIICLITSPVPWYYILIFSGLIVFVPIILEVIAKRDTEIIKLEKDIMNEREYKKRLKEHGN